MRNIQPVCATRCARTSWSRARPTRNRAGCRPGHLDEHIRDAVVAELKAKDALDKLLDPAKISAANRKELATTLETLFGTPSAPKVAIAGDAVDALKLDERTLRRGSIHYRRHCLHCHGLAGDGRGPTGPWVAPHPRDYRPGQFKFLSTNPANESIGTKPRRADLIRTVSRGIEGTSMPAFGLLPEKDVEELASYVMHLSLRGEVEFNTMLALLEAGEAGLKSLEGGSIDSHANSLAPIYLEQWKEANGSVNTPPAYPADLGEKANLTLSVGRGYKLFIGRAACISCHADYGRQPTYKYDAWGTLVRPANLTVGTYRGGRRPVDVYLARDARDQPFTHARAGQPGRDEPARDPGRQAEAHPGRHVGPGELRAVAALSGHAAGGRSREDLRQRLREANEGRPCLREVAAFMWAAA